MRILYLAVIIFWISCSGNKMELPIKGAAEIPSANKLKEREELTLTPREYIKWTTDRKNNLFFSKTIDKISFSIQYKPIDYIICKELKKEEIQKDECAKLRSELGDMEYFDLRLAVEDFQEEFLKYDAVSTSEYERRLNYCAFQMQKDIKIVSGNDTIPCSLFHFERAFDLVPYGQFMLGFEKSKGDNNEMTFLLHDNIFNKGIIKFNFPIGYLKSIPKLSII